MIVKGAVDVLLTRMDQIQIGSEVRPMTEQDRKNIEEQGKLTKELAKQIEEAKTLVAVEDLYRPYKQKKTYQSYDRKGKGVRAVS